MERPTNEEYYAAIHYLETTGEPSCLKVAGYLLRQIYLRERRLQEEEEANDTPTFSHINDPALKALLNSIFNKR